jgi:cyanate permease
MTLPIEMMPKEEVGTASGLVLAIGFTGGGIGPLIAGRILDLTGSLDLSFLVLAGLSIASAGIAFMIPETVPKAMAKKQ